MMELNRKDELIGVGAVVVAAVLVLFLRSKGSSTTATEGGVSQDIPGGFASASTVYVPTESYNLQYNTYKGSVSYSTNDAQTTTSYAPVNSPTTVSNSPGTTVGPPAAIATPIIYQPNPPVVHQPPPIAPPPVHTTTGGGVTNPPTKQTGTTPKAPGPKAPAPPAHTAPQAPKPILGTIHYATPAGGFNQNSIVDYVKEHGGNSSFSSRATLAANNGIKNYTGTAAQNQTLLGKLKTKYGA